MRSDLQQVTQQLLELFMIRWVVSLQEQPEPSQIEVVSVTEEDLPPVDTPTTFNVSPLGSFAAAATAESQLEGEHQVKSQEEQPPSPGMPVTKVQPFLAGESLRLMPAHSLSGSAP